MEADLCNLSLDYVTRTCSEEDELAVLSRLLGARHGRLQEARPAGRGFKPHEAKKTQERGERGARKRDAWRMRQGEEHEVQKDSKEPLPRPGRPAGILVLHARRHVHMVQHSSPSLLVWHLVVNR